MIFPPSFFSLKSAVSPESAKVLERQLSLNIENSPSTPPTSASRSPHTISSNANKLKSNNTHANSSANHPSESFPNKTDTNCHISVCSSEHMKHHLKSSLIPQPVKHLPDLNGNTSTSENNPHLQHLLSKKEALLHTAAYTEKDTLIKELNVHIEKAKVTSK